MSVTIVLDDDTVDVLKTALDVYTSAVNLTLDDRSKLDVLRGLLRSYNEMSRYQKSRTDLRLITIWSEGYAATGERGHAQVIGTAMGHDFKEAVETYAREHPSFARYYDRKRMTHWGRRLFDNETDARRSFG